MSREKQDDWKRSQLRIPFDQYSAIVKFAEENNLSLNSAILELVDKGLDGFDNFTYKTESEYQKEMLKLLIDHRDLQDKLIQYQEELIKLNNLLRINNIDI